MSRDIAEKDWKIFRELHTVALERLCEKILAETRKELERPAQSAHEKYLAIFKLIEERDDDIAQAFNDFRRSTATMQIGIIHKMGLLTAEELRRFSPEMQQILALFSRTPEP